MKRGLILFVLFSIFSTTLFAVQKISKRFLIAPSFFDGSNFHGTELRFYTNNRYKFVQGMPGSTVTVEGLYVVWKNKIYLHPSTFSKQAKTYLPGKSICTLSVSSEFFLNTYFLEINPVDKRKKVVAWKNRIMKASVPKFAPGAKMVYKNIPVVVIGYRKGYTTSNVKIRSSPSLQGRPLLFQFYDSSKRDVRYVPKFTSLKVIARTVKKMRIGRWDNYWYLVNVGLNSKVWIYGEFIIYITRSINSK